MQKGDLFQIIFLILILLAIASLIFTTMTLIKNKDIISSDPLNYGMKLHNFSSCSCLDFEGKLWHSVEGGGFEYKSAFDYARYGFNDSKLNLIVAENRTS